MPFIKGLTIHGFRGFAASRTFHPRIPDGTTPGSGLTVLVGPNNSGKSTIIKALVAVTQQGAPAFHVGQRNVAPKGRVRIELEAVGGATRVLKTIEPGGAPTEFDGNIPGLKFYCVPARRQFASAFGRESQTRENYSHAIQLQSSRQQTVPLHARLQLIAKQAAEKKKFAALLFELMGYRPDWTIEQHETG